MNSVVIGGLGVVGTATRKALGIYDYIDKPKSSISYKEAADKRYIFICLPTPVSPDGRYKTDDIVEAVQAIHNYGKQNVFIIRSTVYPGFAKSLINKIGTNSVVSNPEFLSEDSVDRDVDDPNIIVVGGEQPNYIEDVVGIWRARYRGADIFKTDTVTAELAKMAINGFYTTKVVFANQIYDYAEKANANYGKIEKIMYARKWIGKNHLSVWHKGGRGAGGKCLSKDTHALANYTNSPLIKTVDGLNKSYLQESNK